MEETMQQGSQGEPPFFSGFRALEVEAGGVRFAGVTGGEGAPLLLLHGFPQTHIAWRKVAPTLARYHTVVIPDLPGYGASRPHAMIPRWSKRRVAEALVALMRTLGHDRFALAGHDRGARAGYRLVLDHPHRVTRFAALAVVPTLDALQSVDHHFAQRNYHWFLLAQKPAIAEVMLAAAPDAVLDQEFASKNAIGTDVIENAARDAYRTAFRDPSVRHAMCEDYRASFEEDLAADHYGRKRKMHLATPRQTRSGNGGPGMSVAQRQQVTICRPRIGQQRSLQRF
jgi:haloacetate dehalogenase